jgi:hypothetical protein
VPTGLQCSPARNRAKARRINSSNKPKADRSETPLTFELGIKLKSIPAHRKRAGRIGGIAGISSSATRWRLTTAAVGEDGNGRDVSMWGRAIKVPRDLRSPTLNTMPDKICGTAPKVAGSPPSPKKHSHPLDPLDADEVRYRPFREQKRQSLIFPRSSLPLAPFSSTPPIDYLSRP